MKTRFIPRILVIAITASTVHAAEITVSGLKSGTADCYEDAALEGKFQEVTSGDLPRSVEDLGQSLRFVIGGHPCWIDRSEVVIDGLPTVKDCVSGGKGIVTRGQGSSPECVQKKKR